MKLFNLLLSYFIAFQCCTEIYFIEVPLYEEKYGEANTISTIQEENIFIFNPNAEISTSVPLNNNYSYSDNYMIRYYRDLCENILANQFGSCSYVAMGMLLSYFDTFWNDNTIHNTFEENAYIPNFEYLNGDIYYTGNSGRNSPGVFYNSSAVQRAEINSSKNEIYNANYDYYDDITNSPYDLQAYLMLAYAEYYNYIDLNSFIAFGLSDSEIVNVLNDYITYENLSNVYNLYGYSIFTNQYTSDAIKDIAVSYIQQGYPVLITAEFEFDNGTSFNHALVGYDCVYDGNEYNIYGHFGNHYFVNTYVNLKDFYYFDGLTTIHLKINRYHGLVVLVPKANSHIHSNNYKIVNEFYCPCQFEHLE